MDSIPQESPVPLADQQCNQIKVTIVQIAGVPYVQIAIASPTQSLGAMVLLAPKEADAFHAELSEVVADPAISRFLLSVEETPPC